MIRNVISSLWAIPLVLPLGLFSALGASSALAGAASHGIVRPAAASSKPSSDAQGGHGPDAREKMTDDLANRLQAYFANAKKELGLKEPWQKKLFEDEAMPEFMRFIRDYRSAKASPVSNGAAKPAPAAVEAEIDYDGLKQFLRFYAPKSLKRENASIVVVLRPETSCEKCMAAAPEIKAVVGRRLERRGLKVLFTPLSELGGVKLGAAEIQAAASRVALEKQAVGALVLSWQVAEDEDVDAAHADEKNYTMLSNFTVRDVSSEESRVDLLATGSFERSTDKILTDAFTELGSKLEKLEITQSELKREEILLRLNGVESFSQYQSLKTAIQESLRSLASVEEQRMSRGKAVFAVFTEASAQSIVAQLGKLKVDSARLGPVKQDGHDIQLDILPSEAESAEPAADSAPAKAPARPAVSPRSSTNPGAPQT